jgi:hypothetical protein
MAAAEAALKRLLAQDFFPSDFAQDVRVEVITTAEHRLSLATIAQRIIPAEPKAA